MTLNDYLKIFRQRWLVIAGCALAAAAVVFAITPSTPTGVAPASSYTATATLLVSSADEGKSSASMGRIPLYLTTGEIPRRAAEDLGFTGDPALLAADVTVTPDFQAQALTVSASDTDADRAAAVANAFAEETVAVFEEGKLPGTGDVSLSILQPATPIADEATGRGGFVVPPGRGQRAVLAGNLGLLLGLALALVIDRVDSRIRTRDQIHAALRLPIIAEVPKLSRSQRGGSSIAVADDPLRPYADAYRAARTALTHTRSSRVTGVPGVPDYHAVDVATRHSTAGPGGAKVILVTSALAAEGKTTSTANLAASFAETGQRVLVLDADLRSPDTHNLFDVPQGAGISDFVVDAGDAPLDALIRPTSIPGVRIVTAGTRLAHPASLSSRLGHLLDEARTMADVVIVDTAPLLAASDVYDILPMVDTVLLVVRSGRLTEAQGNRASELLGRFQVPVGGVIVVGASTKGADGYGYGYGYGETKKGRKSARRGGALPRSAAAAGGGPEHGSDADDLGPEADSRRARRTSSA
jgi:capsular exopolysaccharide synthesis family protein